MFCLALDLGGDGTLWEEVRSLGLGLPLQVISALSPAPLRSASQLFRHAPPAVVCCLATGPEAQGSVAMDGNL